jgi:hypothetical protein
MYTKRWALLIFALHLAISSVALPVPKQQADSSLSQTRRRRLSDRICSLRGGSESHNESHKESHNESSKMSFTKIRQTIFPIHGPHEVKKFLLIGSMKFFIIMALTLTRDTKDTLIVTQCGAEAIAFLKVRRQTGK